MTLYGPFTKKRQIGLTVRANLPNRTASKFSTRLGKPDSKASFVKLWFAIAARDGSAASQGRQADKARFACGSQDELFVKIGNLPAVEQHDDATFFDGLDRRGDLRLQLQGAKPLFAIRV